LIIIPAIDILDNKVVRLEQGIMENAKDYNLDPISLAKSYEDLGIKRLHIVDLNAAKGEINTNSKTIENIAKSISIDIELGGGIRDIDRAKTLDNLGVKYFILGTIAVKDQSITELIIDLFPNRVILGLDAKGNRIATDGWYKESSMILNDMVDRYRDCQIDSIIYTDISKDGMLAGLNLELTDSLADYSFCKIIASGGVSSMKDIEALTNLDNSNIYGVVVGKAIYEGIINLSELV